MLSDLENYYLKKEEPQKSCLLALRSIILEMDEQITEGWKYRMPFFFFKGKRFCYLWTDKVTKEPYIGIVEGRKIEHPALEQGNRSRMKILRVDAKEDLQIWIIEEILRQAIGFCKN